MKDGLSRAAIERLAGNLRRGFGGFDAESFVTAACAGLDGLELKARVNHVAKVMALHLPTQASAAIDGILRALPDWDRGDREDSLRGFASWPVFAFIEDAGTECGELALRALGQLTHLFTAEFSVRSFVERDPAMALAIFLEWSVHPEEHVRRLASEGLRPRLPWASKLTCVIRDPKPVLQVLERLVDDESVYVRRSVANNLSDIAVDHPELVIETCRRWLEEPNAKRRWIAKRATRNLIKSGHADVWALHGFTAHPDVVVKGLRVTPVTVTRDQSFSIDFVLVSQSSVHQRLVVDFVVHHVKAGGSTSPKVFKLSELVLKPGENVTLSKNHAFRTITTRRYYPGPHRIEVQVNGVRHSEAWVELL